MPKKPQLEGVKTLTKVHKDALRALVPQELKDYCREIKQSGRRGNAEKRFLSVAMIEKFLELTARGLTTESCCALTGIGRQYAYQLKDRFPSFADSIAQAKSMHELRLVDTLDQAMEERPDLALKVLERRHSQGWSEKRDVNVSGNVGHSILTQDNILKLAQNRGNRDAIEIETTPPAQLSEGAVDLETTAEPLQPKDESEVDSELQ